MASSSEAIDSRNNYDVFLSFRGPDTRHNFTSHLKKALRNKKINVFIDNEIERGKEITPYIEGVIEGAKVSIIIFSKNYAESTFCLDELSKIMECRDSKQQFVLPIFYKVEPLKEIYEEAFERHERTKSFCWRTLNCLSVWLGFGRDEEETMKEEMKVKSWKSAFHKALQLAGEPIDDNSGEAERIEKITNEVSTNLKELSSSVFIGEELICSSELGETAKYNFNKIWKRLMNDEISRIGVYGMGGVGKTTIATHINNQLLESGNSSTHVFWVTVSKYLSIRKLQNDIAKLMNIDLFKEDDERKRAAKLRKKLELRKFVLILDDVWKAFELEDVGIPSLVNGQKLLLTSRSRRVCERMECQPIEVKPLSQQEAMDLFMKESKYKMKNSLEWRETLDSIVRECAGLPLAIVVIAKRMRGVVEIGEWRNVLRKLKKPCKGENHEMEEEVFKPLKLSYDSLPDNQYRQCFLYYSLFPEDFIISPTKLIDFWIGEGLIGNLDSKQAEFDKGHVIINELINMSLLEYFTYPSGSKDVKMHDVIRDMALIIIGENSKIQDGLRLQDLYEENERCVSLKSVLIMDNSMLEKGVSKLPPNCSKLSALIFDWPYFSSRISELPSCFFANMQNLTVLDMGRQNIKSLPDSISNLRNLRVLNLTLCQQLQYLPSLAGLTNLWHLNLCSTYLKRVPNGMDRLINLNVLNLSWYSVVLVVFPIAILKKLSNLQMLKLEKVEVEADVLTSLKKLEILWIVFYNLESLNSYLKSEHWQRLVEYYIVYNGEKECHFHDDLPFASLGEYKKKMFFRDFRGGKGETDIVLPENIQHLKLGNCNAPMVDVLMNSTFNDLQQLEICGSEGIQHLFTPALAQRVLNVETLEIGLSNLFTYEVEEIVSAEEEFVGDINSCVTIELPKLKFAKLEALTNLRSIYKGRIVSPSLEHIYINNCQKLERLPFYKPEERNIENLIKLELSYLMPKKWLDSIQWDPNAKSMYQFKSYHG